MAADALVRENKKRGTALAENLAARSVEAMLASNLLDLKNLVDELRDVGDDVLYAFVLDNEDQVLMHTFPKGFPTDLVKANRISNGRTRIVLLADGRQRIYDFASPVTLEGSRLGAVRVGLSCSPIQDEVRRLVFAIAVVSVGALILAVFLSTLFGRRVTKRLARLRKQAEEMVKGNLNIQAGPLLAKNCWEIMNCGRTNCPAYGQTHRRCWLFSGTLCSAHSQGEAPEKGDLCSSCPVFRNNAGDEIQDLAETFDFMALTIKTQIEDLKRAKKHLRSQQEQLIQAQKMESLGKLAGGVAHEINTPLGIILGYAQILQEEAASKQMFEDLKIIEKQAKVCRKIVADLLGFSRQAVNSREAMSVNESIMESIRLVQHTFGLDKIEFITDLDRDTPVISGDPERLKQVWLNLFSNALDAMPNGGTILVRTRLDPEADKVVTWIADTGSGIAKEDLTNIFDPFFTTKAAGKGTGLGLSVSFGIIEDHGGEIRAESPAPPDIWTRSTDRGVGHGGGAVFIVDLPLDHRHKDPTPQKDNP
ncbi:MAG: PAS domain-containing sensor histidine kinase [Desulfovibrionaceae bacterium]|nr:PAS domain-containing sensor histidine kinase [Desulfovibrionaceae bacterium]